MSINIQKSTEILFNIINSLSSIRLNIIINNISIELYSNIKFLGLFIDNKLNWKIHISHILRKLSKSIAILNKIKYKLKEKSLIIVYYDIFKCHLDYCSHIWGNNFESNIKPISKLKNRVIRLICKDVHSSILYKKNP